MKKIVRLTEKELHGLVKQVIKEQNDPEDDVANYREDGTQPNRLYIDPFFFGIISHWRVNVHASHMDDAIDIIVEVHGDKLVARLEDAMEASPEEAEQAVQLVQRYVDANNYDIPQFATFDLRTKEGGVEMGG